MPLDALPIVALNLNLVSFTSFPTEVTMRYVVNAHHICCGQSLIKTPIDLYTRAQT